MTKPVCPPRRRTRFFRWLAVLAIATTSAASASAVPADSDRLPVDPQVTIGHLDNGLTYYLRENHKPRNRAVLRLVVNAGSILEAEDQRGLAHFLEHMAFNGTKHFPKQALVDFLESIGMRFGADLNAYTSFDETVYLLEIPLDREEVIDRAFQILADWAHAMTLAQEDIDAERGVILEEWRLGRGARQRVRDRQLPVLLHDSRYAVRLPIGSTNVIETAPRSAFLRFYHAWYRPNLMAVVIVGDFDKADMERRVRHWFAPLENPPDAPPRKRYPVPDHADTLFSIVTDPELPVTTIQIAYLRPPHEDRTRADYRRTLIESLYTAMFNERLDEKTRQANPPYLGAGIGKSALVRAKDAFFQMAAVKEGAWAEGLKALLLEARRVRRDGFTATEFERAKANLLRAYERAFAERDKLESSSFAGEYTRNFLRGEPIPGIAAELALVKEFLPGIALAEVNTAAQGWTAPTNRVVLYSAPEKPNLPVPTRDDILAVMREAETAEVESYTDDLARKPLLDPLPRPGKITATRRYKAVDVTRWTLSNGARVWLKPTDFQNDQVLFTAVSPGGLSLASDRDYVPAATAVSVVTQSGVGDFDAIQLRKQLAGKVAGVTPSIGATTEGLSGSASPRDLETLFQLAHLYFTRPRADAEPFAALRTRLREAARNRLNDPGAVFNDELERVMYGDHPRHRPLTLAWIAAMDRRKSLRFYRRRFASAGDFDFVFVGNFTPEQLRPLVEHYLASLPDAGAREKPRFHGDDPPRGHVTVEVFKGVEPRATVRLLLTGDAPWRYEELLPLRVAVEVLRLRLRETLREEQGGVYGVGVSGRLQRWPKNAFASRVAFGCDPARADALIQLARDEIQRLRQDGPRPGDLAKVKEIQRRGFEKGRKENPFWLANLEFRIRHGLDPAGILNYPARVDALTADQVRAAARRYFAETNRIIARLVPLE